MIENDALANLIRDELPDAEVGIFDRTGTMDHFNVTVRSQRLPGKDADRAAPARVRRAQGARSKTAAFTPSNSKRSLRRAEKAMDYKEEIAREIAANTILVYGKGTKAAPRCGFTLETIEFFDRFGYPFEVVDVLENVPKREALAEMTDWPTLPKVFINGKFYGDTDILGPMARAASCKRRCEEAFGGAQPAPKQTIDLR